MIGLLDVASDFFVAQSGFFENYQQPYFAMVKLSKLAMFEDSKNAKVSGSLALGFSVDRQRPTLGLKVKQVNA